MGGTIQTYKKDKKHTGEYDFFQIKEDEFELISEWYFIAILNLAQVKNHKAYSDWIAQKLGISNEEAFHALEVLTRLKLIKIVNNKI